MPTKMRLEERMKSLKGSTIWVVFGVKSPWAKIFYYSIDMRENRLKKKGPSIAFDVKAVLHGVY